MQKRGASSTKPQHVVTQLKNDDERPSIKPTHALTPPPSFYQQMYDEMPEVHAPFFPPLEGEMRGTLLLDLDETLVHYFDCANDDGEDDGYFLVRPGCTQFLEELSHHYELAIFTAAMQDYADWIIN